MYFDYIRVKVNSPVKPSFFMGSTLRGTFGYLLKEDVCIAPSYECKGCSYQDECLYYEFYEAETLYRSFRFDIRLDQENYDFGLYLFGDHSRHLRTLIKVLHKMLLSHKLANGKVSFPNSKIFLNSKEICFDDSQTLMPFVGQSQTITLKNHCRDLAIVLQTPILIKDKDTANPYKMDLTLDEVLFSIYKRKIFFETKEVKVSLPYTPSYRVITSHFQDVQTKRRSDRQRQKIILKGVVGELIVTDIDVESYELLKWGEILAVGNKTAFGHGVIELKT